MKATQKQFLPAARKLCKRVMPFASDDEVEHEAQSLAFALMETSNTRLREVEAMYS